MGHGKEALWICGVLVLIVLAVLGFLFSPTDEDCRYRAAELGIPCMHGTENWDEDECECMSAQNPGVELEFSLSTGGCNYDD